MWNVWKFELCLKNENNCQKDLKHKCMTGFTPGNDLVIICLPKLARSPNICFSPLLSFLSFLYWPLLSSNVFNDDGFLWKGAMEKFYVKCVKIWTLSQGRKTQKMETTAKIAWSTSAWLISHLANWDFRNHPSPFKKLSPYFPRNRMDLDLRS